MAAEISDTICNIFCNLNNLLWGLGTFLIIIVIGVKFTISIDFYNILHIVDCFKGVFKSGQNSSAKHLKGRLSQFQTLSTSLAASMGTGNIIGVAAAISMGGPGAIFWMWVSALFGTAIGFTENVLGGIYKGSGTGPMGYISTAFKSKRAAVIYAIICASASFGIGNMTQSNAISAAVSSVPTLTVSPIAIGAVTAVICGVIIFGGRKKVASAAEKLIPIAAVLYLLAAITVIVIFGNNIINVLTLIVSEAFGYSQITGGICGEILRKSIATGLRRGIFSNEAGMGSSVLVHSESVSEQPIQMGMFAVVEVIIDTFLCCTATAFVILLTGADRSGAEGLAMVTEGFRPLLGDCSEIFITAITVLFAFCTLIGWYFYGEKCLDFVFKTGNSKAIFCYRILYISAAFIGAVSELELVWETADTLNWFMLAINLTAVTMLHKEAAAETKKYTKRIK